MAAGEEKTLLARPGEDDFVSFGSKSFLQGMADLRFVFDRKESNVYASCINGIPSPQV
jgi:hypothetical protein